MIRYRPAKDEYPDPPTVGPECKEYIDPYGPGCDCECCGDCGELKTRCACPVESEE